MVITSDTFLTISAKQSHSSFSIITNIVTNYFYFSHTINILLIFFSIFPITIISAVWYRFYQFLCWYLLNDILSYYCYKQTTLPSVPSQGVVVGLLLRWVPDQFSPHIWVESGINLCVIYLGQVDITKPIPFQVRPQAMFSDLKARLRHRPLISSCKPSILVDDFNIGSPLPNDVVSLPHWLHKYVASSTRVCSMAVDTTQRFIRSLTDHVFIKMMTAVALYHRETSNWHKYPISAQNELKGDTSRTKLNL